VAEVLFTEIPTMSFSLTFHKDIGRDSQKTLKMAKDLSEIHCSTLVYMRRLVSFPSLVVFPTP
jgi:hypothetical protein